MRKSYSETRGAAKQMMTYWRNCIADSDRMDVADSRLKNIPHIDSLITENQLSKEATHFLFEEFQKMKSAKETGKTAGQPKLTEIQILISPLSITTTQPVKHAERTYPGIQSPKHPLWIPATLSKSGTLTPSETLSPWISRNVMEPLPPTSNQMAMPPIIGEIRNLDCFLTENKKKSGDWKSYINYCNEMFEAVTGQKPDNYTAEKISVEHRLTVLPDEAADSVNIGILAVYDYLNRQDVMPPLLTRFATVESPESRPLLNETGYIQQSARHIGQMGAQHPLSPSQREALYHYQQLGRGEILAINGPPGTGKTMLLQNIVATTLVESAVNGDKPPVIAISSTNNQAIDNVTESFGKAATKPGKLAGRWLPDITSYALFLPATTKKIPPGTHYAKFKGEGLPNSIETPEYRSRARTSFLKKCGDYAEKPFVNINDAVRFLRDKLIEIVSEIEKSSQLVTDYQQKKATLEIYREMGGIEQYGKQLEQKLFEGIEIIGRLEKLRDDWLHETRSRFWFSRLLVQLGFKSAIAKQEARNRLILSRSPVPTDHLDETSDEAIENFIAQTINRYREESKILREKHRQLQKKNQDFEEAREKWQDWQETQQIVAEPPELSALYKKLDTTLRHQAFQLAVHYWEGRWLQEVKIFLEDTKGRARKKMEAKWHRYAMLTPCFVSTFFMLPKFFTYSSRDEEDKNWINAPLLSFIDLLIVDESGQTLVETGGASFALAKKAVVVGDIYQIQPVRKITSRVDAGNIKRYLLKPGEPEKEQRKKFQESGLTTYKGSVMKAAQNASPFQLPQIPERGMFLAEHRRCYDSIIDYCNRLTYRGKLDPLRGNPGPGEALFPPMGYANISSRSERANGSRKNSTEAIAIAGWLKDQEDKIRERYDAVEEAVGIITPFVAQKYEIQKALKEQGFKPARMKFGTVHSLQGAERPIVIFSPVYGYDERNTWFIDDEVYLLNVAVSRARDSFLVFGNMCIFDPVKNSPTGLLAKLLFADPSNELPGIVPARRTGVKDVEHIKTLKRHCKVLTFSLQKAESKVLIVSPFISIKAIQDDKLDEEIRKAVQRKIEIIVYTDRDYDKQKHGLKKNAQKGRDRLEELGVRLLVAQGIHNKTLCVDEKYLVEGSFNWLSSPRNPASEHYRYNASFSYKGNGVDEMIRVVTEQMELLSRLGK